ncbi:MAG: penicillin-binding protein 2 [Pseudomonadota bacterium]
MSRWRHLTVAVLFVSGCLALATRVSYLTVTERDFLLKQGNARSIRTEEFPAFRGGIFDRHGAPLALSTPVSAVWIDPSRTSLSAAQQAQIARVLKLYPTALQRTLSRAQGREFVYLKRRIGARLREQLEGLAIDGLEFRREYRRFYPGAESAAHVVGQTGYDDVGLEGVELAFDPHLRGSSGAKKVLKARDGRVMSVLEYLRPAKTGTDLTLTIDHRLQYFAYQELKSAVAGQDARAASVVLLDARSGDILALANEPSYNPNDLQLDGFDPVRNRAVTDVLEPGSTIKPFTALAALESGRYQQDSAIDTAPGYLRVGRKLVEDPVNRGTITLARALAKSSQVAMAKVALDLGEQAVFDVLSRAGFGRFPGTGLPGESGGFLSDEGLRREINRVTLAYGYGLSASPLQLAAAYLTLANDGQSLPVSILRRDRVPEARPAFDPAHTRAVLQMMERVTADDGTAPLARIPGYRVAGKTGTARKLVDGRYDDERHVALFAGVAPITDPRIVLVVVVDEPGTAATGGGATAAPVFARIGERALRLLSVPPDGTPALAVAGIASRSEGLER